MRLALYSQSTHRILRAYGSRCLNSQPSILPSPHPSSRPPLLPFCALFAFCFAPLLSLLLPSPVSLLPSTPLIILSSLFPPSFQPLRGLDDENELAIQTLGLPNTVEQGESLNVACCLAVISPLTSFSHSLPALPSLFPLPKLLLPLPPLFLTPNLCCFPDSRKLALTSLDTVFTNVIPFGHPFGVLTYSSHTHHSDLHHWDAHAEAFLFEEGRRGFHFDPSLLALTLQDTPMPSLALPSVALPRSCPPLLHREEESR